ncbi:hypothetical protein [Sphingobacterium gobiense]|uniref:Uncharacterized protein n=1 Tax=Sphingobacterium gobiense TaxID=1382456 RepID=A0A2S9JLM8_9SPHI|nr:hypothetical protein [Sphingobacterium gobiense]PRD54063.1 hypothetical protein C5749_11245 [Sphingobacterium gobiense]
MKKVTLFLFSIVFIAFQSCQKSADLDIEEQEETLSAEFQSVKVENGMLAFKSHSHFMETMAAWSQMDELEVTKALKSFDFISYHSDTTLNKEVEVHPDILLQKVINNKGAVRVNDSIFVLRAEEEIIIKGADLDVYKDVLAGNQLSEEVEIRPVVNSVQTQDLEIKSDQTITPFYTLPNTWYGEVHYYSPEEVGNNDRPERVRTTLYASTAALYPSCGLKVKGEAYRRCGLWCVDWRADEVAVLNILSGTWYETNPLPLRRTISPGTLYNREETTIFSFPVGGGTAPGGEHFGFADMQANISYRKANHNPLRTISLSVIGGVLQTATVNW